jgi:hypothetical protein
MDDKYNIVIVWYKDQRIVIKTPVNIPHALWQQLKAHAELMEPKQPTEDHHEETPIRENQLP